MALQRMVLGLCYDGSSWHGWQRQPHGHTLQNQLEAALSRFLAQPTEVVCAGRTDKGVHALNQIVHLDTTAVRSPQAWVNGLNSFLPSSLAVQWAQPVDQNFHARFSARQRTYFYVLRQDRIRSPLLHTKVGWVFRDLDVDAMRQAASYFIGEHDFSSFRSTDCQAKHPIREIKTIEIYQYNGFYLFRFIANAFLHHMVRNLMGALLYVGYGRLSPEAIPELIAVRNRQYAPPTFQPDGLYLAHVAYEGYEFPGADPWELLQQHLGPWSFTEISPPFTNEK